MSDFKKIIEESFCQYSGSVIQSRALVDVRDCLKPSSRQIFYCMQTDKFTSDKDFKKTLKAIGSAMRIYIHGDASCEGIIMRSGQPFAMRYPLIEVEGSYGNLMESANWAAPRYTSSRLSPFSKYLFEDINKDTIDDWRDNYDDTEKYPAVLPSKGFYNIVNGTFGIGVGIASSIPQFNLKEVNDALIKLLLDPTISFDEIYCEPDFATGGIIINGNEVKESLKLGTGKACRIRAKIEIDTKANTLTVTEMPYNVYTNTICQQLEKIANSEENPGIDRINDFTGKEPCLRIYLSKNADPERVIRYVYQNTSLQSSYGINLTMLENGHFPKVFGWKEALQAHLDHEKLVYIRGFEFDLKRIEHRMMIIEAIIKAIANIEEVISTIKSSSSTSDANIKLQNLLLINEEQAKAILDIKLAKLAKLEISKYEKELQELQTEHERITKILNSKELLDNEIIKGLQEVSKKFGDKRRTEIQNLDLSKEKEDKEIAEVVPEDVVVILTQAGNIKRIPRQAFKSQRRGGKGVKNEDDAILATISTNTIDNLMLFTSKGIMYKLLVDNVPAGTASSRGVSASSLVKMGVDEKVIAMTSLYHQTDAKYVMFFTKKGLVKKTLLDEYCKIKRGNGIAAIKLKEGDSLANVTFINQEDIIVVTKNGMAIHFPTDEISPIGRVTAGVRSIKLETGDEVLVGLPIHKDNDYLAIITENGYGKKCELSELPLQARGGKGVYIYKVAGLKNRIAAAALVDNNDNLLLIGKPNSICISASDLPLVSRISQGNIMIKNNVNGAVKL